MTLRRLACLLGVLVFSGALFSVAVATGGDRTASRGDGVHLTIFRASRPGLNVKLWVGRNHIVGYSLSSRVRCKGGSEEQGSGAIAEGANIRIRRSGIFRYTESESYEGGGTYFTGLEGKVHQNTVTGFYRAWEERSGEEGDFPPRCGTLSPRGRPIHFVAHRVSGRSRGISSKTDRPAGPGTRWDLRRCSTQGDSSRSDKPSWLTTPRAMARADCPT